MFKQIAKVVASALQDPWIQGTIGLVLLARATNGMTQQLVELQDAIKSTHEMNTRAYMDWVQFQKQARVSQSENVSEDNVKPKSPVGEYYSEDARPE